MEETRAEETRAEETRADETRAEELEASESTDLAGSNGANEENGSPSGRLRAAASIRDGYAPSSV